jgi:quinoprotein glucose dehydrogenase
LADIAANEANAGPIRLEALAALADWRQPSPRNRVHGAWELVDSAGRDVEGFVRVMSRSLPGLIRVENESVRSAARDLAASLGVGLDPKVLLQTLADREASESDRLTALRAALRESPEVREQAMTIASTSDQPALRVEACLEELPTRPEAIDTLRRMLLQGSLPERLAVAAQLDRIGSASGDAVIDEAIDAMSRGELPASIHLEVLDAAQSRIATNPLLARRASDHLVALDAQGGLGRYVVSLDGGDRGRGDRIVHQHASAVCLKCHAIGGFGGNAAPELQGIGSRMSRQELLESLIQPNARVAEGFGPVSAMPGMSNVLTPSELRDVVEYLSSLK